MNTDHVTVAPYPMVEERQWVVTQIHTKQIKPTFNKLFTWKRTEAKQTELIEIEGPSQRETKMFVPPLTHEKYWVFYQ